MIIEWVCARCAEKEQKVTETDPVILRLCTSCKVENWVRPFGHVGESITATDEELAEAAAKASSDAKTTRAAIDVQNEAYRAEKAMAMAEAKAAVAASEGVNETAPEEAVSEEPSEEVAETIPEVVAETVEEAIEEAQPETATDYSKLTKKELLALLEKKEGE
jgi:hypothetical protein